MLKDKEFGNDHIWFTLGETFAKKAVSEDEYRDLAFDSFTRVTGIDYRGKYKFEALTFMGILTDLAGERDQAVKLYEEALSHEQSFDPAYSYSGIAMSREWVEERLKTRFNLK